MQAIDRDVLSRELLGEIDGEQDLRQLALAIGAHAAIAASEHHVGKVDCLLARRRNVDDARGFAVLQHGQQQTRQQESREIIDREAQFEAVGAEFSPRAARADPGVVDERVETVAIAPHRVGEGANLGERGEIRDEEARLAALLRDSLNHSLAAGPIATVDDDAPALRGQALGDIAPDAVGRAGDENGLAFVVMRLCSAIEYEAARAARLKALTPRSANPSADLEGEHHRAAASSRQAAHSRSYSSNDLHRSRSRSRPIAPASRR